MWAAGCLLFEMCLLRMPFNAPDFTSLVLKILQGDYDPIPRYLLVPFCSLSLGYNY